MDSEATSCPAPDNFACDPEDLIYTGAPRGSVGVCRACVADSECATDYRCVPTAFAGGASFSQSYLGAAVETA